MSAEAIALSATFPVGRRYRCTVTIPLPRRGEARSAIFEWEPEVPSRLTKTELGEYRRGRDAVLAELAAKAGLNLLLVEI